MEKKIQYRAESETGHSPPGPADSSSELSQVPQDPKLILYFPGLGEIKEKRTLCLTAGGKVDIDNAFGAERVYLFHSREKR
ncbi:MAG: hypothetical protein DDT18_01434 [Actinobacteria bacterium]|nr:hypothetical protein [Actinomycetota bacterium]